MNRLEKKSKFYEKHKLNMYLFRYCVLYSFFVSCILTLLYLGLNSVMPPTPTKFLEREMSMIYFMIMFGMQLSLKLWEEYPRIIKFENTLITKE